MGAAAIAGCSGGNPGDNATTATDVNNGVGNSTTSTSTTTSADTTTQQPTTTAQNPGQIGKTVEAFEKPQEWAKLDKYGKRTGVSKDVPEGKRALKLTASKSEPYVGVFKAMGQGGADFSGKNFSAAVKVKTPQIAKLTLELYAPDRGHPIEMTRTFTGPTDRWMRVDFGVTGTERDPRLKQVQEIRLVARGREDGQKVEMHVDDLRVANRPDKGYVFLTFDDSHITHYTKGYKMMQQYGFPGVEGVIPQTIYTDNRLDTGQLRKMRDAGWDIASHPYVGNKPLPEFSKAKQQKKIKQTKQWLDNHGFTNGSRVFITPKNLMGKHTWDLVNEYHDAAFRFGGSPTGLPMTGPHNMARINGESLKAAKRMIDFAGKYKQGVGLMYHVIGKEGISEKDFRATLDYIKKKKNVEVSTPTKILEKQTQW